MIEHCVSAFLNQHDAKMYRFYVTDALKAIAENTMRFNGGREMTVRYADLVNREIKKTEEEEDDRSCSEIVDDIWSHGFGNRGVR